MNISRGRRRIVWRVKTDLDSQGVTGTDDSILHGFRKAIPRVPHQAHVGYRHRRCITIADHHSAACRHARDVDHGRPRLHVGRIVEILPLLAVTQGIPSVDDQPGILQAITYAGRYFGRTKRVHGPRDRMVIIEGTCLDDGHLTQVPTRRSHVLDRAVNVATVYLQGIGRRSFFNFDEGVKGHAVDVCVGICRPDAVHDAAELPRCRLQHEGCRFDTEGCITETGSRHVSRPKARIEAGERIAIRNKRRYGGVLGNNAEIVGVIIVGGIGLRQQLRDPKHGPLDVSLDRWHDHHGWVHNGRTLDLIAHHELRDHHRTVGCPSYREIDVRKLDPSTGFRNIIA